MFQSSIQSLINNKNIILLVSTISSGTTVNNALRYLSYCGVEPLGISTLLVLILINMN